MPYKPNIPAAPDLLSNSQPEIQGNFQAANTVYAIDHFAFDNNDSNDGKHKKATLVNRASNPVSVANEIILFTKARSGGSTSQLFSVRDGNPATQAQLSSSVITSPGLLTITGAPTALSASTCYATYLPGGINTGVDEGVIMLTGFTGSTPVADGEKISLPITYKAILSIQLTAVGTPNRVISVSASGLNNFTIGVASGGGSPNVRVYYTVIGTV